MGRRPPFQAFAFPFRPSFTEPTFALSAGQPESPPPRYVRKAGNVLAQALQENADGRDRWPSRAAFLLAAMGGCVGQGNPLRYPSVDYSNYELQLFIPYLLAVFLIAVAALILEVCIGQAYRGRPVIACINVHKRLEGFGVGPVLVSFIVVQYFNGEYI